MTYRLLAILAALSSIGALVLAGCGQDSSIDPNYSTEIKMTDEQKAKEKEIMSQQPGNVGVVPRH